MRNEIHVAVAAAVLTLLGCGFNGHNAEPGKAALIMLDREAHRLTVRNTGDTDLVDCEVSIAPLPLVFDGSDPNVIKIAVLHTAESIDIPLSTFPAYRDGSIFRHAQVSPFAAINCHERTIRGKVHFGSVSF
jgi:hypothetical protein